MAFIVFTNWGPLDVLSWLTSIEPPVCLRGAITILVCVFWQEMEDQMKEKGPMKTSRWGPVAILLLGVAVLSCNGEPNKEVYRLAPYRPVLRFRHKVLIVIFYHLQSLTSGTLFFIELITAMLSTCTWLFWVFGCLLKNISSDSLSIPQQTLSFQTLPLVYWCEAQLSMDEGKLNGVRVFIHHYSWIFKGQHAV